MFGEGDTHGEIVEGYVWCAQCKSWAPEISVHAAQVAFEVDDTAKRGL